MARLLPLLSLAGCPFLFGPPDLSRVDRGDDDDTVDTGPPDTLPAHTGTPTPTPTPTAETGLDPDAPTVLSFEAAPHVQEVAFLFAVADPQQDFSGGSLTLSNGTITETFAIPGDIPDFNGNGVNVVRIPRPAGWIGCDTEVHESWTLTVTDFGDHTSPPAVAALDAAPVRLPEIGDRVQDVHRPWESVAPPFLACLTFDADPYDGVNDGVQLSNDRERVAFDVPPGRWRTELAWSARIGVWFSMTEIPAGYPYACDVWPAGNVPAVAGCTFEDSDGGPYLLDPTFLSWDNSQFPPSFDLLFLLAAD